MPIERNIMEFVAAADWTDDCRIRVELKKRVTKITPTEAREFRAELDAAIAEAERGLADMLRDVEPSAVDLVGERPRVIIHVHPECVAGKCGNCDGQTLTVTDEWVSCQHICHSKAGAA